MCAAIFITINPSIPFTDRYRFLEIQYHRPEETHKGRVMPARVETVVIFVPDVWHLLPTRVDWESTVAAFKEKLAEKLALVGSEVKKEAATEESQALLPAIIYNTLTDITVNNGIFLGILIAGFSTFQNYEALNLYDTYRIFATF